MLTYEHDFKHDLEGESLWLMVKSNQIPWGAIPRNSIPYVQELGEFYANSGYYTRRESLISYFLKYTVDGGGILEYMGKTYRVGPGDLFWIDCQNFQHYYTDPEIGNWHSVWVHFSGDPCKVYYEQFMEHGGSPVIHLPEHNEFQHQVRGMIEAYSHKEIDPTLDLRMSGVLTDMMIQCVLNSMNMDMRSAPQYIRDAQVYLATHYGESNSLDELSRRFSISKHHFVRQFKHYMGVTPREYIISTRIHEAKQLLRSTDLSVGEVARKVGIEHEGHFINLFKRSEGMTPWAYHKYWHG